MIKFELNEYHRNITKEQFIADLKRVATALKKDSITREEYKKHGKFHPSTWTKKFGSWFVALNDAGLEKTRNLGLSEKELIGYLIRVSQKINKQSVTQEQYRLHGNFGSSTLCHRFGSWFKALEKAGLQRTRNFGITDEEYFENLEEIWVKLGRQPYYNDIRKPLSKYSAGAYERRFGTWRKALEEFVAYINQAEISINSDNGKYNVVETPLRNYEQKHKTKRNISWRLRFIIMKRDNFKCKNCGQSPATNQAIILHVDHIIPYSKGGETVFDNLQTLCSVCNIGKSDLD